MTDRFRWTAAVLACGCAGLVGFVVWSLQGDLLERLASFLPALLVETEEDEEVPPVADPEEEPDDATLDLEHPTDEDWHFLFETLEKGTAEGRKSAARALVAIGDVRAVRSLFHRAVQTEDDAAYFCGAALEILRLQAREGALAEMIIVLSDASFVLDEGCQIEISDRYALIGGTDVDAIASLAGHDDVRVRTFVAAFLVEHGGLGHLDVIRLLAQDPELVVRERALAGLPR